MTNLVADADNPSPPVVQQPHRNATPRPLVRGLLVACAIAAAVAAVNWLCVYRPVSEALHADERNQGYTLAAHWAWGVWPDEVVLDLVDYTSVAPADLLRGLLQASEALEESGLKPSRIVLARRGTAVFYLDGAEFLAMGEAFKMGQNPLYLVRTFPEKVYRTDGTRAFGSWEGGLLAVAARQMEDVSRFGRAWLAGTD